MNKFFQTALLSGAACWVGFAAEPDSAAAEARNRALKAELKTLETQVVGLENKAMRLEESIRITTVAKELMDGTRLAPPRPKIVETVVFEDGVDEPLFFDATEAKVKNKDTWLKLEQGVLYRFEGEVKVENLTGTDRVKFGAYAPVRGAATNWPGCGATGAGTFDWQKVQFSYRLPAGGAFMLSVGPSGGRGKVWFRNVRGYKVTEVEE